MNTVCFKRLVVHIRRTGRIVHRYTKDLDVARQCHGGQHGPNCFDCLIYKNIETNILVAKAGDVCCFFPPDDSNRRQNFWFGRYLVLETKFIPDRGTLIVILDWSESTSWYVNEHIEDRHKGKVIERIDTHEHFRVLRYDATRHGWIWCNIVTEEEALAPYNIRFFTVYRMRDHAPLLMPVNASA